MISIKIPKSFINNLKKMRLKDFDENLSLNDIYNQIKLCLIHDSIIEQNDLISWIIIRDKFQGIYLVEKNLVVYFAQMLTNDGKARSRNTYLSQNFFNCQKYATIYKATICVSVNPYDINKKPPTANFIKQTIQSLYLQGVIINKSLKINVDGNYTFEKFLSDRYFLRSKNRGNSSTAIAVDQSKKIINIFGKLDGANSSDTYSICKLVIMLKEKSKFYKSFAVEFNVTQPYNKIDKITINKIFELGIKIK